MQRYVCMAMEEQDQDLVGVFDAVAIGEPPDDYPATSLLMLDRHEGEWLEAHAMHGYSHIEVTNDSDGGLPASLGFDNDDAYVVTLGEDEEIGIERV